LKADDVDQFIRSGRRGLPAAPQWRDGNRAGERRASLDVALDGIVSPVSLEMTIRLNDPQYLMALLLCSRSVICRLCMTTGHRDRRTGAITNSPHFHSWEANRGGSKSIPKTLNNLEVVPAWVAGRDKAFAWFLERNGIDSPRWLPVPWPHDEGFI